MESTLGLINVTWVYRKFLAKKLDLKSMKQSVSKLHTEFKAKVFIYTQGIAILFTINVKSTQIGSCKMKW